MQVPRRCWIVQTSGDKVWSQPPFWRAAGFVRLLVIGAMCILPIAVIFNILNGSLPWRLPQKLEASLNDWAGSLLLAGIASFLFTPVAVVAGLWSIFKSTIDRRVKIAIACFLIAQMTTVLGLLAALWMTGGRIPH